MYVQHRAKRCHQNKHGFCPDASKYTDTPSKHFGTGYEKPYRPSIPSEHTTIDELIENDSCKFFKVIELPYDFLENPVEAWPYDAQYQAFQQIVNNMQVVNGIAERGEKLCYDCIATSKDEARFQTKLQMVKNHRIAHPN